MATGGYGGGGMGGGGYGASGMGGGGYGASGMGGYGQGAQQPGLQPSPQLTQKITQEANRLQVEFQNASNGIENVMRGTVRQMCTCGLKCCDDKSLNGQAFQACMEQCQAPMSQISNVAKRELDNLQSRYLRCAQVCQDQANDHFVSSQDQAQVENRVADCFTQCTDSHIQLIPGMLERIKEMATKFN
eukprot:m.11519 g.11519  ORF g.11519 m.11519 type:complete len:188 (-) comp4466_c0_seq1:23-586(-)